MNKIYSIKMTNFDICCEYRIFELDGKKMFDFIQTIYKQNNRWNRSDILTDFVINRCELNELLSQLNITQNELENNLNSEFKGFFKIIEAIENSKSKSTITAGFSWENRFAKKRLNQDYPIYMYKDKMNYSYLFTSVFNNCQEKAVKQALNILTKTNYPLDKRDVSGFEDALIKNILGDKEFDL